MALHSGTGTRRRYREVVRQRLPPVTRAAAPSICVPDMVASFVIWFGRAGFAKKPIDEPHLFSAIDRCLAGIASAPRASFNLSP